MRVYFGKELRQAIHDAFLVVQQYLDDVLDIKEVSCQDYDTKFDSDITRNHTIYAISDQVCTKYAYQRETIFYFVDNMYLGSTELKSAYMGKSQMLHR